MIEPDLPCNIGSNIDPIESEFLEWYKLEGYDENSLYYGNMYSAWNEAWEKYSPKKSEDTILNHIKTLLILHPDMKMDRGTSMKILAMFNRELGI